MAYIFITKSDGTQNKYRLPNSADVSVDIGRNDDCLISLPDVIGISGLHCSIKYVDGHYVIKDEGSSNGTIVDGARLQEEGLLEKTNYHIGDSVLTYYAEGAAPAPAATPAPAAADGPSQAAVDALLKGSSAAAPAPAADGSAATPKLKRSAAARVEKIKIGKYAEESLSPIYVMVVILLAFAAGLTIRHWKETGAFLPQDLFASAPAEQAPAAAPAPAPAADSTKAGNPQP